MRPFDLQNIGPIDLSGSNPKDAQKIADLLTLAPHPEGGRYRETYRHSGDGGGRGACTHIYFLLALDEVSVWHRVRDAVEIWHWAAGAPLALTLSEDGRRAEAHQLGPDIATGQSPAVVVPADCWQTAESLGGWTLVSCVVAPAFDFAGFEIAPKDWRPSG